MNIVSNCVNHCLPRRVVNIGNFELLVCVQSMYVVNVDPGQNSFMFIIVIFYFRSMTLKPHNVVESWLVDVTGSRRRCWVTAPSSRRRLPGSTCTYGVQGGGGGQGGVKWRPLWQQICHVWGEAFPEVVDLQSKVFVLFL